MSSMSKLLERAKAVGVESTEKKVGGGLLLVEGRQMTKREAAAALGVSIRTIERRIASGVLDSVDTSEKFTMPTPADDLKPRERKLLLECERLKAENKHLEERRRIELEAKREELESVKKERYEQAYKDGFRAGLLTIKNGIDDASEFVRREVVGKMTEESREKWEAMITALGDKIDEAMN